jgi:stage V sporulation protein SpoVS
LAAKSKESVLTRFGRAQIANISNAAVNEAVGAVAGVTGRTEKGAETELELLLLPIGP